MMISRPLGDETGALESMEHRLASAQRLPLALAYRRVPAARKDPVPGRQAGVRSDDRALDRIDTPYEEERVSPPVKRTASYRA